MVLWALINGILVQLHGSRNCSADSKAVTSWKARMASSVTDVESKKEV